MSQPQRLYDIAHARTGDKGNRSSICLISYRPEDYSTLVDQVTPDKVASLFADRRPTSVSRYLLPQLHAINFVIDDVLDGGVNESLNLDTHGKTLSFRLLELELSR